MAVISIARGCYSSGRQVAEAVASTLGYKCVNREIILDAVRHFHISEKQLIKSLEEVPGFINRLTHGKEKYIAYFRAELLEHVKNDNVVYHGHAGHLLLPQVRHLLRIRINADMGLRVKNLQREENLLADEAEKRLRKEDARRYEWTKQLYNRDIRDSMLYDIVFHVGSLSLKNICDLICAAAESRSFETRLEDERLLRDAAIIGHIQAALQDICDAEVTCHEGNVKILVYPAKIRKFDYTNFKTQERIDEQMRAELSAEIMNSVRQIPGIHHLVCDIVLPEIS